MGPTKELKKLTEGPTSTWSEDLGSKIRINCILHRSMRPKIQQPDCSITSGQPQNFKKENLSLDEAIARLALA